MGALGTHRATLWACPQDLAGHRGGAPSGAGGHLSNSVTWTMLYVTLKIFGNLPQNHVRFEAKNPWGGSPTQWDPAALASMPSSLPYRRAGAVAHSPASAVHASASQAPVELSPLQQNAQGQGGVDVC